MSHYTLALGPHTDVSCELERLKGWLVKKGVPAQEASSFLSDAQGIASEIDESGRELMAVGSELRVSRSLEVEKHRVDIKAVYSNRRPRLLGWLLRRP